MSDASVSPNVGCQKTLVFQSVLTPKKKKIEFGTESLTTRNFLITLRGVYTSSVDVLLQKLFYIEILLSIVAQNLMTFLPNLKRPVRQYLWGVLSCIVRPWSGVPVVGVLASSCREPLRQSGSRSNHVQGVLLLLRWQSARCRVATR